MRLLILFIFMLGVACATQGALPSSSLEETFVGQKTADSASNSALSR